MMAIIDLGSSSLTLSEMTVGRWVGGWVGNLIGGLVSRWVGR